MMATSIPSCGVCEYRQIYKLASIWCSDCDEVLCLDCNEHHGISKATRKHGTIPISDYHTLPDYIKNIKQNTPMSIENMQTELQQTINTIADARGCCLLPDCRMVFTYPTINKVSVVKQDGSVDFSLSVTAAYGIAYNDTDTTLAISSCWNDIGNQITIIELTKQKVKKTITPIGQTMGIAATYKTLVYHIYNNSIRAMDLTDESTRDLNAEKMDTEINIAVSGHKLCYCSCMYHTVVCCNLNGTKQWSFKDTNLLKHPYGISVDNDGNVYVIGHGTQNVVVITHDEQKYRELLSWKDGLTLPYAINFGRATNHLLVAANNCKVYLYKVSSV